MVLCAPPPPSMRNSLHGMEIQAFRTKQKQGNDVQVGIIPTEGFPALVCDLCDKQAVLKLAAMKHVSPKKPMSMLVRNFADVDTYTLGWPQITSPGDCESHHAASIL
jgi:tRNA A37 threonylcarbamoyladenosine synthetase subunit TsaC/SUA5/YrdC